jgi:hypothetical protein
MSLCLKPALSVLLLHELYCDLPYFAAAWRNVCLSLDTLIGKFITLTHGWKNSRLQFTRSTKFRTVAPDIFGSSVTNLFHISHVGTQNFEVTFKFLEHLRIPAQTYLTVPNLVDGFPYSFIFGTFIKICCENPNLIKMRHTYWTLYVKTQVGFIVSGGIKFP